MITSTHRGAARTVAAGLLALALCAAPAQRLQAQPLPSASLDALMARAASDGRVKVLVRLSTPLRDDATLSPTSRMAQRQTIASAQARLEADVLATSDSVVTRRYATQPLLAVEVDANALARLRVSGAVSQVVEDRPLPLNLLQSTALIEAPTAWARGQTGSGWAVAVLDSGVDGSHPFLAGKVVAEACFSTTSAALRSTSTCPGGVASLVGAGAGVPCVGPSLCAHGTHVAGIAAGGLRVADGFRGVAPGAPVIAVQVISLVSSGKPGAAPKLEAWSSDLIAALEHVYTLRHSHPIAAVNMSLGTGRFEQACDNDPLKPIIDQLRAVGIATVVAAGNNGFRQAMNTPACISSAISVAATCDEATGGFCATGVDGLASYSNVSSLTSLAAPGSFITSSLTGTAYGRWSGTSMAAPHVAGAWAVYRQWQPEASVDAALAALKAHGLTIADTRAGGVASGLPRLNLGFVAQQARWPLNLTRAGAAAAQGTVQSVPAGVSCGSVCTATFDHGTRVTLTASAPSDAAFAGWSGACTGVQPSCTVTMDAARSVSAAFNVREFSRFSFSAAQQRVSEGQATLTLTVTRGTALGKASVAFSTADGSALAGADYLARSGVVRFAPGQTSRSLSVPIRRDTRPESTETFSVQLSLPEGGELGLHPTVVVTIDDDD